MADLSLIRDGGKINLRRQVSLTAQLAVPAILAQLSSILMQYIDASMVGRLGANESASVGLMASSLWLFTGVCSAVTTGFSVQVAHRLGGKDPEAARAVIRQGITACLIFSIIITVIGLSISGVLPSWLRGADPIKADASVYFAVFISALPLLTINYLSGGFLRAAGNMKIPTLINILMCVLDIVFNYFLIFPTKEISVFAHELTIPGAGLGVLGAALGSFCATAVCSVSIFYFLLFKQPDLKLSGAEKGSFMPTKAVMRRAINISVPMSIQQALYSGAQVMLTTIVSPLGVIATATNALAVTAESLCYMPGFGIGEAATTLVGQSHGAGRRDLVIRFGHISVALGIIVMSIAGALLYIGAPFMMSILTNVPEIIVLGTEVLRIQVWAEPLYAASIVAYGAFIGVGDALIPAIMNFGSIWVVRIPMAALLAPHYGLHGVWIAMAVELCFRGSIFLWRMWSKKWLKDV